MPSVPNKPNPPEVSEQLHEINAAFRTRKNDYFEASSRLNWLACVAAGLLAGVVPCAPAAVDEPMKSTSTMTTNGIMRRMTHPF